MRPATVAIIGSFRRHFAEVQAAAQVFLAAGLVVNSPAIDEIVDPGAEFIRFRSDPSDLSDADIQARTLALIFRSDFVYVVAPGGHVGRATAYELGHVRERGMAVYFSEAPRDLAIDPPVGTVVDPLTMAKLLSDPDAGVESAHRPRVGALVTADLAVLTVRDQRLNVLLVKRKKRPYERMLALPGGFVRPGESLEDTARRELAEETGLENAGLHMEQIATYSTPDRDDRGRVITTAFLAIAPNLPEPLAGTDASRADWIEVEPTLPGRLAFDHGLILSDAIERARARLENTTLATAFCGRTFTMAELQRVYEAVWGIELDDRNFARKVQAIDRFVVDTGRKRAQVRGRPAELYRRGPAKMLQPPMLRSARGGG